MRNGGIDLTPANMNVQVKTGSQESNDQIKFHLNPAMLAQLQKSPGFVPVVVSMQPLKSVAAFLEIPKNNK